MGGISVWSMHFIGNRAIELGNGETALQIVYSPVYTVLSFFIPVAVVFVAFGTSGAANDQVSITRLSLGGMLSGLGICGMHYLGQAGISNYDCIYNSFCVVGAAVIAILASVGALVTFFVFRSSWRTTWWKRACCALLLAVAVSGMHWLASIGTLYKLRLVDPKMIVIMSRSSTVIIVLILVRHFLASFYTHSSLELTHTQSVVACFVLLFLMFIAQRRVIMLAKRAQQVVLAVAVFDMDGRILVSPQGLLPTRKITNIWLEQVS
jgi:NO-binding membrane sensor protein with MHYT domain